MSKPNEAPFCLKLLLLVLLDCSIAVHLGASLSTTEPLPTCRVDEFRYDFTECDPFGGRWRVSVPIVPGKCSGGQPSAPIRVNKCYTSCEGGQYFNMSSLLCQDCASGHYSLGGGEIIDSFNNSHGQLPTGFNIATESTKHTPELNKKCNGWRVDPVSNQLVSTMLSSPLADSETTEFGSGCVSVVTYTVKVVKTGRLRFMYQYRIPDDVSSSLLFTFHYRMYANGESMFDDESSSNIRFPMPTMGQNFEVIEVGFARPGLYVFTWKSVLIGNLRGLASTSRSSPGGYISGTFGPLIGDDDSSNSNKDDDKSTDVGLFKNRLSTGIIRIKKIMIEGVAYASECSPCEPGTFAANSGQRECLPCPPNTASASFGASQCPACDAITEYANRGSTHCRKRPVCGPSDFYSIPIGKCDLKSKQQKVQYKWIEPRICIDSNHVFPSQDGTINCTESANESTANQCDLGMESKADGVSEFCQFCPESYYRCEKSQTCQPCPPFTSPFYALSVFMWNSSLPAWSTIHMASNYSSVLSEDYFADNPKYLNSAFTRQCIRTDRERTSSADMQVEKREDQKSGYYGNEVTPADVNDDPLADECDARTAWQPFHDHIRTGASAMLDTYLILSISIPGFRSTIGGEISFVFETNCENGDHCELLFVETKSDESELQELAGGGKDTPSDQTRASSSKKKLITQQSQNTVIQVWPQSTNGRTSYRYKIDRNITVIYSWVFKRSTSFQSYAKIYSLMLTNSRVGSAIECRNCPYQSLSTPNQCVTCPEGKYLEVANSGQSHTDENSTMQSVMTSPDNFSCKQCPLNHVLNKSVALPLGIESCLACGPNLIADNRSDICYSNCNIRFGEDAYDLRELMQPIHYKGGNLFTAAGTQFLHLFKISLCDHPKSSALSTCLNNITGINEDGSSSGVRSFICRSTMIPDGPTVYATQSVSLGDELIGISRDSTFQNITVHPDFLVNKNQQVDTDYHLFFTTKAATNACPSGRRMTITMRCSPEVEKSQPGKAVVSTPKSCPDGTCDGCTFHLLLETGTAAACRVCRPYTSDYETLVGECVNGQQEVHYINPKGCVIKKFHDLLQPGVSSDVLVRPCTVLLPRHVQMMIAIAIALGLLLLLLVFHFWNQNRSLEYKYSKLIENSGKGDDDLQFDNCCAENEDDEDDLDSASQQTVNSSHKLVFSNEEFDKNRNIPKHARGVDKNKKKSVDQSHEMKELFGKSVEQSAPLLGNHPKSHPLDEEGYETIHLNSDANQIV